MGTQNAPQVVLLNVEGKAETTGETMTAGIGIVCNGRMVYGIKDWGDENDSDLSWADTRQVGQNIADALGVPLEEVSVQMAEDIEVGWMWHDALDLGMETVKEQKNKPNLGM